MKERQGGQDRSNQSNTHSKEQGDIHKEVAANTPLSPLKQGEQGWYERPHEELVKGFKNYVQKRVQATEGEFSPAEIIAAWLRFGHRQDRRVEDLHSQLRLAWDALAFDHYTPNSLDDFRAGETLHNQFRYAKVEAIKLSDPLQIRVIDVLTEAVGIPHQKGQSEIKIPEKLRHYNRWIYSKENEERLDKFIAEREARHTEPKETNRR